MCFICSSEVFKWSFQIDVKTKDISSEGDGPLVHTPLPLASISSSLGGPLVHVGTVTWYTGWAWWEGGRTQREVERGGERQAIYCRHPWTRVMERDALLGSDQYGHSKGHSD